MNEIKEIKDLVYQSRVLKRITGKELAKKTGISNVYLSRIEHGKDIPSVKCCKILCSLLNINIQDMKTAYNKSIIKRYSEKWEE